MTLTSVGRVLLVGAGHMGGAMLEGWLADGLPPGNVVIRDPGPPPRIAALIAGHSIALNPETFDTPDVALIAIKPQMMADVLPGVVPLVGPDTLILSVAAGTTIANLAAAFGADQPIIRAMPNTPSAVGRGMTVLCPNDAVSAEQLTAARALVAAIGDVAAVDDEALMDAVTGVSGSGPAYVFLLAECLAAAGEKMGLPSALAAQLARQTVAGAGELLYRSDQDAATLRENVTSPNGTTAAALGVLMGEDRLRELMAEAVDAATRRSRELAG